MTYLVKFWDKHKLTVSDKVGEQIVEAKNSKVDCIRIGDSIYETRAISYVERISPSRGKGVDGNLPALPPASPVRKETLEKMKGEMAERFGWPQKKYN